MIDGSYCTYSAYGETGNSPLVPAYPDPAPGHKGNLQRGIYRTTNVISISYGDSEADVSYQYQRRQCNEYMKLGMQGISIVVSLGDDGVAGPPEDHNVDGCLGQGQIFAPEFSGVCPYVTAPGECLLPPAGQSNEGPGSRRHALPVRGWIFKRLHHAVSCGPRMLLLMTSY